MKTFRDSNDREWTLQLNISAAKRIRDLLGVNLLNIDATSEGESGLQKLGTDIIFLCDVIWCIVKPEAEKRGVTDEEFGESLGGEVILKAQDALYDELMLFFRGLGRADLAKIMEKQGEAIRIAVKKVEEEIDKIDMEDLIQKKVGSQFTSLRESAESTPDRSRLES